MFGCEASLRCCRDRAVGNSEIGGCGALGRGAGSGGRTTVSRVEVAALSKEGPAPGALRGRPENEETGSAIEVSAVPSGGGAAPEAIRGHPVGRKTQVEQRKVGGALHGGVGTGWPERSSGEVGTGI